MIDNIKLGFWDVFTYMLIGFTIFLSALIYAFAFDFLEIKSAIKNIVALGLVGVVFFPLIALLMGMLFEPISNMALKLLERHCKWFKRRKARNLKDLMPLVEKHLPDNLGDRQKYRFCKATIEKNFINSNISVFLARFGFYRSIGVLVGGLFPAIIFLTDMRLDTGIISVFFLVLGLGFIKRAQTFQGHMEYEVYFHFLAYKEDTIFKGKNQITDN
ncbi:hypothetical protein MHM98_10510 [Psychrobium sp. MM17-31]|uniref:hypothetical protein n=1 Tax=Psychrobium sp. MM17-31 TaxID=2917758 RepID=UPI001EF41074|nr:hypothetical protein [Psychrobium sp. MM17-31]MCG7531774.1 hypothetical protein [Psychrobium sp. MM17-31]